MRAFVLLVVFGFIVFELRAKRLSPHLHFTYWLSFLNAMGLVPELVMFVNLYENRDMQIARLSFSIG